MIVHVYVYDSSFWNGFVHVVMEFRNMYLLIYILVGECNAFLVSRRGKASHICVLCGDTCTLAQCTNVYIHVKFACSDH